MEFENQLTELPGLRAQVVAHLPIVALVFALVLLLASLHAAAVGVAVAIAAHLLVALAIVGLRWRRARASA